VNSRPRLQSETKKNGRLEVARRENARPVQLLLFFGLLAGVFPTGDASGHVLDVGVTQLLGGLGGGLIGFALGIAAIRDDERAFVLGQAVGELVLDGGKVQRRGDMPLVVRLGAVDIDDHGFLGFGEGP